jgi:hypothetical protein
MFYDTHEVDNALLCQQCEGRLDIPKILPCGEAICSLCETTIQINDKMFDCMVCKEKHEMPKNGLPINHSLMKILSVKLKKISRGKSFDSLEILLNEIQNKHNFIKFGIENSSDIIKEHCSELRSDVQLKAEKIILIVNEFSSKIIEEIDEYERESIEFNRTNLESVGVFKKIANELESFHSSNTEYLKHHVVDYDIVIDLNKAANILIKKAELEVKNLKDVIFDGKFLVFEENKEKISKSILGSTKIDQMIDSLIILNRSQMKELMSLCQFIPAEQKWNLIYRASRNGFEASSFHSKCDNKPNTLVIIKSENGNVFGGYTEQSWFSIGSENKSLNKSDPNSFIFSFINKDNKSIKIKGSENNGISCNINAGPIFGHISGKRDIRIFNNSNINATSYSNLGHYYIHPDYASESNEAKLFSAGSYKFLVSEIEVYTK